MIDFQIKRTSRHCHATERELAPGESFYSELVLEEGEHQRRDYCEEAWQGPSEQSIGWWRSRIPKIDGGRVYWAPRDVLLSCFESLQEQDEHQATAYVMGLLLVRKKILKLIDSREDAGDPVIELQYARENKTFVVPVVELDSAQINQIQGELAEQLFTDQPPE